jgi:2,4-diaminopentanoate dehydrogenase
MSAEEINVAAIGLGSIGRAIASQVAARPGLRLAGAADPAPGLAGRPLRDVIGPQAAADTVIAAGIAAALTATPPGVAVLAVSSRLSSTVEQVLGIVSRGWNVLSTCEELSNPWVIDHAAAQAVDDAARRNGVTVLRSGINPGLLMDALPLLLTALCRRVDRIEVRRVVDTNRRRESLQRKADVGISREAFLAMAAAGTTGHVGLAQSAASVARRLGWQPFSYAESLSPVIATAQTQTPLGTVPPGGVLGQDQQARLSYLGRAVLDLSLQMWAGAPATDAITIAGEPSFNQVIDGGINGDIGTEAMIVNSIRPVYDAAPSLLSTSELLPLACTADGARPAG